MAKAKTKTQTQRTRKRGRPWKINGTIVAELVQLVRKGNYAETAASAVGIDRVTFYRWLKEGARLKDSGQQLRTEEQHLLVELSNAVKSAAAIAETEALEVITEASKKTWQAAAWRLERMYPQRYGFRGIVPQPDPEAEDRKPKRGQIASLIGDPAVAAASVKLLNTIADKDDPTPDRTG